MNALLNNTLVEFNKATFKVEEEKTFITGIQFKHDSFQFAQEVEVGSDLKAIFNGVSAQIKIWLKDLIGKVVSEGSVVDLEKTPQQIVDLFYFLEFCNDLKKCKKIQIFKPELENILKDIISKLPKKIYFFFIYIKIFKKLFLIIS